MSIDIERVFKKMMVKIYKILKNGAESCVPERTVFMTLYEQLKTERACTIVPAEFCGQEMDCAMMATRRPVSMDNYIRLSPEAQRTHCPYPPAQHRIVHITDNIICEEDVAVILRDGTKIYADIFRPTTNERVPVILSWSYYTKRPRYANPELSTRGVPKGAISKYCMEEGPDPLYWCQYGYAVANVDPRGIGNSEGTFVAYGKQDAKDGRDFIEWIAQQPWCNGKVGMAGNSCLAMVQWRIAAEKPPHLACIAPWEGTVDAYREGYKEGGISGVSFRASVLSKTVGRSYSDDGIAMMEREPYVTSPYWQDKIPDLEAIDVPAYITAGWNHFHINGSMKGYLHISSRDKWFRGHREFEWPDFYSADKLEDLKRFYDRYLKDIHNGWELTPRVRIDVMDAYDCDYQLLRAEEDFPIPRTVYKRLYLDAGTGTMGEQPCIQMSSFCYDAASGQAVFDYVVPEDMEVTGFSKLHLFVEAREHDDMDLFVNLQKGDAQGEELPTSVMGQPHPGAWGKMRVSRRKLDEKLSTSFFPVQAHDRDEKLTPGEVVEVDIPITATSRIWHKGQILRIRVAGRYIRDSGWFEPLSWETDNAGYHVLHTGGDVSSYLEIPVVPPKYSDNGYVYR